MDIDVHGVGLRLGIGDNVDVGMGAIALDLQRVMDRLSTEWVENRKIERLWSRDASLWTGKDEDCWLGWLDVAQVRPDQLECLRVFQQDVRSAPLTMPFYWAWVAQVYPRMFFGIVSVR